MGVDLTGHTWTHLGGATRDESEKAAKYVAIKAVSKADRIQLLAMLGLLPAGHKALLRPTDHGSRGYKAGCRCKRRLQWNRNRINRQKAARKGATS